MARSNITSISQNLRSDDGAVLFSLVKGEQIEFPINLSFVNIDIGDYTIACSILEGDNGDLGKAPVTIQPGGISIHPEIRKPINLGDWDATTNYSYNEYVTYNAETYILIDTVGGISEVTPDVDDRWQVHIPTIVYIRIPKTLGDGWVESPEVDLPVYGFLEIIISEPVTTPFKQIWKDVRGLVAIRFSPTAVAPPP